MNSVFLLVLGLYLLVFVVISILDFRSVKNFEDYAVAGRVQGTFAVTMTLLATVVGASTTIGITDTVYSIGFPGIWWLAFGAIGLILQSFLISKKVRATGAATLPDLTNITVGRAAEMIIALIIVIAWVGVVAGQLVAMNSLISFATGRNDKWLFILMSLIIIIYTLFGGQSSVVKTDKIQFIVIVIGVVLCCLYLYLVRGGDATRVADNIEFINQYYRPMNLLNQLFVIGGVYFLGPDIISRNFISKDESIAKKSALIAGIGLFIFSIFITLIGMWAKYNITPEELGESKTLMYVVSILPKAVSIPLIFGLLSAILSSTDTCLINASSIFVKDILRKESVMGVRIAVAIIGLFATVLAVLGRGDIMSLLTGAYSIYTPGIIFPLLIAILCHKKKEIRQPIWVAAVVIGGLFGIVGTYFAPLLEKLSLPAPVMSNLSLIGMGLSLLVALISVKWNSNR